MPSIILDFVFITVNPVNMAPVFRNFTNKHTKKYYDEGEKNNRCHRRIPGALFWDRVGSGKVSKEEDT